MKIQRILFAVSLVVLSPAIIATPLSASFAAPDSTTPGPHMVKSAEYRFPAVLDPDILKTRPVEVWGKLFYPADNHFANTAPLVVMLHGNHATCRNASDPRYDDNCEYTTKGTCPTGYIPVPNHEGYDYIASNLASWGYWVVSINANRGITCGGGTSDDSGLNLARGRLVLKHLSLLYKWSTEGGAPASLGLGSQGLIGKFDIGNVGLMGHSRGGEGVRAAFNLYKDKNSIWPAQIPGLNIKAIFEIGAVDGQTSRVLNADGIVWNQLLPMCDGDVYDLQGRFPFERMLLNGKEAAHAQKSLYEVWGANHNFFNTEWKSTDAYTCQFGKPIFQPHELGSPQQQKIALASIPAFFRSHLGVKADEAYNKNFNPLVALSNDFTSITQIDRDFTPTPSAPQMEIIDDFNRSTGTSSGGFPNETSGIVVTNRSLSKHNQRAATIQWEAASANTFFDIIIANKNEGRNFVGFTTLDFRVGRLSNILNKEPTTDFDIALLDANGTMSTRVAVKNYAIINGPGTWTPLLKTVRIPLSAFQGVNLSKVHSVRFIFNQTKTGAINLANIRVHRQLGFGGVEGKITPPLTATLVPNPSFAASLPKEVPQEKNKLSVVRQRQSFALAGESGVEIRLRSEIAFPAMNRLPVLKIGNKEFKLSYYSDISQLKELTFTLTNEEYKSLAKNSDVSVINGRVWQFGKLDKWLNQH